MRNETGEIIAFDELRTDRRYLVSTDEPPGLFAVGYFRFYRVWRDNDNFEDVLELPDDWKKTNVYPEFHFEHAEVSDYWAFRIYEEVDDAAG